MDRQISKRPVERGQELSVKWRGLLSTSQPSGLARCEGLGDACNELLEAENVEQAGEVVAERHQAPFATDLIEAADEEVLIAGAAFERPEGVLDDGGAAAHQFACPFACHPLAMTVENIFVFPAKDAAVFCLRRETRCL